MGVDVEDRRRKKRRRLPTIAPQDFGQGIMRIRRRQARQGWVVLADHQRSQRKRGMRRLGVGVLEAHPTRSKRVDVRCRGPRIAIAAEVIRPHSIDREKDDVRIGAMGTTGQGWQDVADWGGVRLSRKNLLPGQKTDEQTCELGLFVNEIA